VNHFCKISQPGILGLFYLSVISLFLPWENLSAKNPILPGVAADPEILLSENTGKFYIYPTTDALKFRAFSSENLIDWKEEGVVLDLADVSWAKKEAWAPSIMERKIDGKYRYFFYFCAERKIGVAVGDSPAGPFTDTGKPLFPALPEGVQGGVPIDPDVFTDPASGKTYIYWGNSFLAMAELADDFCSIKPETFQRLEIPGFFEGTHVFCRNGIYYLTWSQNDTRSVDYRVLYAVSDSPAGPFTVPENNVILAKKPEADILGPGHHSVVQIPGTDRWFIVYHRHIMPYNPNHCRRETCLGEMFFDADGKILPIDPAAEINEPVSLPQ